MGDDFKCMDRDHFEKDFRRDDCDFRDRGEDWGFGDWLPIIIIVFLLCGGTNIFGGFGGGHKDDCFDDNGFGGGSWLLILIVIFLFLGNQRDGKGFLGGLFG